MTNDRTGHQGGRPLVPRFVRRCPGRGTLALVLVQLGRFERNQWPSWVVPAVVAAAWSVGLATAGPSNVALLRNLVAIGGPLVVLSGLHARTEGYLHSRARIQLLPLPIDPRAHFSAAWRRHARGFAMTAGLGTVAVAAGVLPVRDDLSGRGLLVQFALLMVFAAVVEPAVGGWSAWWGRRFDPGTPAGALQRTLGGGWTLPEAVAHLYVPAFVVVGAAALAMPAQLALEFWIDRGRVPSGLVEMAIAAAVVAAAVGLSARRLYARGVFEAVPWLFEAVRTLAGPPVPHSLPRVLERLNPPALRLIVIQFWRTTPVPAFRLALVAGCGAWLAATAARLSLPRLAVLLAVALLWVVPALSVVSQRTARQRLCAALPLDARQRSGRHALAWVLLALPVAFASGAIAVSFALVEGGP